MYQSYYIYEYLEQLLELYLVYYDTVVEGDAHLTSLRKTGPFYRYTGSRLLALLYYLIKETE